VKFCLMFANAGPFSKPENAIGVAQLAEELGFESIWTVEHVVVPTGYESAYPYSPDGKMPGAEHVPIPDPLIWLAYVGAATKTVRLATGILILPQRNPLILAKEVATLDRLTGGRVELGVGVGWLEEEFDALGVPFDGTTDPVEWQLADVRMEWPLAPAELCVFDRPAAVLAVIPIEPGLFRLVSNGPEPLDLLPPRAIVQEEVWRSAFRISYRQVERYRVGRVLLAGDAAHVHSPVGARGMNLGIEDGTILARKLVDGGIETYSAERHPVGARVIRQTRLLTRLMTAHSPLGRFLRDQLFARVIGPTPAVQRALARRIMGLA